jgi:alkylhydroperoxidase family enzyme
VLTHSCTFKTNYLLQLGEGLHASMGGGCSDDRHQTGTAGIGPAYPRGKRDGIARPASCRIRQRRVRRHTLIEKVAEHSGQVTDEDITAARASGLSEDQIFELVVCAAVGQATREYETALLALAAVSKKE